MGPYNTLFGGAQTRVLPTRIGITLETGGKLSQTAENHWKLLIPVVQHLSGFPFKWADIRTLQTLQTNSRENATMTGGGKCIL